MKISKFSNNQILSILKQSEAGQSVESVLILQACKHYLPGELKQLVVAAITGMEIAIAPAVNNKNRF